MPASATRRTPAEAVELGHEQQHGVLRLRQHLLRDLDADAPPFIVRLSGEALARKRRLDARAN